jgi:hypothetical protein
MSFIGISLGVTGVLMIGWRAALAALTPEVRSVNMQGSGWAYVSLFGVFVEQHHCCKRKDIPAGNLSRLTGEL